MPAGSILNQVKFRFHIIYNQLSQIFIRNERLFPTVTFSDDFLSTIFYKTASSPHLKLWGDLIKLRQNVIISTLDLEFLSNFRLLLSLNYSPYIITRVYWKSKESSSLFFLCLERWAIMQVLKSS